jgi:S1-C subfamily serine protease
VISASGKFLGIATSSLSRIAPLAIPVSTIDRVATALLEKGHVARGYLGVGLQPISIPEHLKSKLKLAEGRGLIALSVEPDGPAAKAGLVIGDILVAFDSKPVADTDDVQAALGADSAGKTLRASIVRGGELREVSVTIGERPRG